MVLLAHGVLLYDYFTWRKVKKKGKKKNKNVFHGSGGTLNVIYRTAA